MNELLKPYVITGPHGRWQATAGEIKKLFGLAESTPWPDLGMPVRTVQGLTCWVYPIFKKGDFRIRAYCSCKLCGKAVPIGRLHQHVKAHARNPAMMKRIEKDQVELRKFIEMREVQIKDDTKYNLR